MHLEYMPHQVMQGSTCKLSLTIITHSLIVSNYRKAMILFSTLSDKPSISDKHNFEQIYKCNYKNPVFSIEDSELINVLSKKLYRVTNHSFLCLYVNPCLYFYEHKACNASKSSSCISFLFVVQFILGDI